MGWGGGEGDGTRLERIVNCCVPLAWDVGLDTLLKLQSTPVFCRARELCERRGGRPGLPVPNSPYGLCGRKATFELESATELRSCVKVEVAVLGSPSPDNQYALCGRKATLDLNPSL